MALVLANTKDNKFGWFKILYSLCVNMYYIMLNILDQSIPKYKNRNSPAPWAFNGEPRSIGELSVVLGPYKLRALTHFRALKDQRNHAIIIYIHNDLVGACRQERSIQAHAFVCISMLGYGKDYQIYKSHCLPGRVSATMGPMALEGLPTPTTFRALTRRW